ncbi:MAG: hydroxyacylglutathione hydrolase [Cocleimonas sp.]|nr:hydroxyacylglutathione hydrolase [Cocleimonas sp.]
MPSILPVSAFSDNYIWLLCDDKQQYTAIIDPGDAAPVIAMLEKKKIQPIAILITHRHSDHIAGVPALLQKYPELPVYGSEKESIPKLTRAVKQGDFITLAEIDIKLEVLETFGHTAGHLSYYAERLLFCGDTLFSNGCGRIFDGTIEDLYASLEKIAKLPADTQIFCAHEYTLDNIGFSKWVEPENKDLLAREIACWMLIDEDKPTIPSLLSNELKTNPFLRCHKETVIQAAEKFAGKPLNYPVEVFRAIRQWKDSEYD